MSHLTPEFKHDILRQYLPSSHDNSFGALARHYNIKGGKRTIQRWYAASLEQRAGAGRHRLLSSAQLRDTIAVPIQNRNRAHHAIHYTELLPTVRDRTGASVSLRTIRRHGKESSELVIKAHDLEQQQRVSAYTYAASLEPYYVESIKPIFLIFSFCFAIVFL